MDWDAGCLVKHTAQYLLIFLMENKNLFSEIKKNDFLIFLPRKSNEKRRFVHELAVVAKILDNLAQIQAHRKAYLVFRIHKHTIHTNTEAWQAFAPQELARI